MPEIAHSHPSMYPFKLVYSHICCQGFADWDICTLFVSCMGKIKFPGSQRVFIPCANSDSPTQQQLGFFLEYYRCCMFHSKYQQKCFVVSDICLQRHDELRLMDMMKLHCLFAFYTCAHAFALSVGRLKPFIGVCMLSLPSGCSTFLPQSRGMHSRLNYSKLAIGVDASYIKCIKKGFQ